MKLIGSESLSAAVAYLLQTSQTCSIYHPELNVQTWEKFPSIQPSGSPTVGGECPGGTGLGGGLLFEH